ncbi:MAG: hypothetical protein NO474_04670 [Methanomassiliicoccales archaeon]|nr:hypothetical protein [Methanomassiliicoccales archaeon]
MKIESILKQAESGDGISREEALTLLKEIKPKSKEMYLLMHTADHLSRRQFNNKGEIHAQIGLNWAPCSKSCEFCVFAEKHGIASKTIELTEDEVVRRAKNFENAGANAIFLMTTADYEFSRFLEIGKSVRKAINPNMPLVANIGDFGPGEAHELVEAGFTAVYHVLRLGEGVNTRIDPSMRIRTIKSAKDAGLDLSFCVEPIGPEHSIEEIVDRIFLGKDLEPTVMATMRRITIPGTPISAHGQISEIELAKIEAVTRLVMGKNIMAMGVHEPNMPSLLAGCNQIYAETGPNPRDTEEETSKGRGRSVEECKQMLWEVGYETFVGPAKSLQGPLRNRTR